MMKTYNVFACCYLPPIEFFYLLAQENHAIIDINEHFVKQTYRNRFSILSPNGKLSLVIPLVKKGKQTKIKNIKIAYYENWQKTHWKSIEAAYRSSPYFEFYEDDFKPLFLDFTPIHLIDFNLNLLNKLIELIGLPVTLTTSNKYVEQSKLIKDYRTISPKTTPNLNFSEYIQVFSNKTGFEPNLSILDLLFNEGPNTKNYLVSGVEEH